MALILYRGARLLDILKVCYEINEDEREQYAAFVGKPYDPEEAALEFSIRTGPKWLLCENEVPVAVAGFDLIRTGVWQDWMASTPDAWNSRNWRDMTRYSCKVMKGMLTEVAHRLQCVSLRSRIQAHKWYGVLGLQQEGVLEGYGVNGEDAIMFARTRTEK